MVFFGIKKCGVKLNDLSYLINVATLFLVPLLILTATPFSEVG